MTLAPQHPYRHSENPRLNGRCDCGQPEAAHPPKPQVDPERSPEWEREFIRAACSGTIDPSGLIEFAQRRAHPGPLRDGRDRDWGLEIAEELSDAANYSAWSEQMDDIDSEAFPDRQRLRVRIVQHAAIMFSLVEQLRSR